MTSGPAKPRGLLLLGTSHVGKSTCAAAVAATHGWPVISTDRLGRHPGRPWTGVPQPVLDFYLRLNDDAVHWFLRVHHKNMRPVIHDRLRIAAETSGYVMEGAALRPEYLAGWNTGRAVAVCLHADDGVICRRIAEASARTDRDRRMRTAIDRFTERSLRENAALTAAARAHDLPLIDTSGPEGVAQVAVALRDLVDTAAG